MPEAVTQRMVRVPSRGGKDRFVPENQKLLDRVQFQKGKMKIPRYATVLDDKTYKKKIQVKLGHNGFICWIPVTCILKRFKSSPYVPKPKPKAVLPPIILLGAADKLLAQIRRQPILFMPCSTKLIDHRTVRTQRIWKLLLALSRLKKLPPSSWDSLTNVDLDHIAGIFRQRGFVKLAYVGRPLFKRYKRIWSAIGKERKRRDPEFDKKMNALRKGPSRWQSIREAKAAKAALNQSSSDLDPSQTVS